MSSHLAVHFLSNRGVRVALSGVMLVLLVDVARGQPTTRDSAAIATNAKVEIRSAGRTLRELAPEDVTVDTISVIVRRGDDVRSLLRSQGIRPDGHGLAIFYDLNSQIPDADELAIGSSVVLPKIVLRDRAETLSSRKVTFAIVADTSYKATLRLQATRIAQLTDSVRQGGTDPALAAALDSTARAITRSMRAISESSIPLTAANGAKMERELEEYQNRVAATLETRGAHSDSLRLAGRMVAADVKEHASASRAGRNHTARFEFGVVDTSGADRSKVVIVYAVPLYVADRSSASTIVKLNPGIVAADLDVGRWIVWVENMKGDTVSIAPKEIKVRSDGHSNRDTLIAR